MTRLSGRRNDELRELSIRTDFLEQPHGSVLYAQGKTIVLCTATVEEGVPRWLARLLAGEALVVMMTDFRGASNEKAKRELGWEPLWSTWADSPRVCARVRTRW